MSRECGECTACCTHLKIDTKELQKLAGVDCEHLSPRGGCAIYDQRPQGCRDFLCAWRQIPDMPDDWRPDRSGVLVVVSGEDIPPGYATTYGLHFSFIRAPAAMVRHPSVVRTMLSFVRARIPIYLHVQGPVGRVAKRVLLNERLLSLLETGNPETLLDYLASTLDALEREPKEVVVFIRKGPAAGPAA